MFLILTFFLRGFTNITMALPQGLFYETLGKKIRKARDERNLSQDAMARAVGLSRTSITNIEKGRQPVQVHILMKIAETLNMSLNALLTEDQTQSDKNKKPNLKKYKEPIREWVADIIGAESAKSFDKQ